MKTKIQDMTSGSPGRLIILFAIPLMLGNICQQLYTMVDTMVVGQIAGVEALAALGAVDFLMWVVTGISTGLTQGFSIQLSQYYGAKDFENLRKSLAHSYRLTAFIAVGVFILSQSFAAYFIGYPFCGRRRMGCGRGSNRNCDCAEFFCRVLFPDFTQN